MNDVQSKIDKLKSRMSVPEQEMQANAAGEIRDAKRYMEDIKPPKDEEFVGELKKAQDNGMTRDDAESVYDSYTKAGEELSSESGTAVKTSIHDEVAGANEKYDALNAQGADMNAKEAVYDNTALKSESLFRAGIENDNLGITSDEFGLAGKARRIVEKENELISQYSESLGRSANLTKARDEKIADRNDPSKMRISREEGEKEVSSQLKKAENLAMTENKRVDIRLAGQNISFVPFTGKDGSKGVKVLVNGTEQTLGKAASGLMNAVPGLREGKIALEIIRKITNAIKQQMQQQQHGAIGR